MIPCVMNLKNRSFYDGGNELCIVGEGCLPRNKREFSQ